MNKKYIILIYFIISFIYSILHFSHFNNFYQTDKLNADQKKELFYSEGAFYYSFYNDFVNTKNTFQGFKSYFHNEFYEAPNSINPHKRFNISFELIAGTSYKLIKLFYPVSSFSFYNYFVIFINSLLLFIIGLICLLITKNYFGLLLPLILYLIHHDDATRLVTNTALRENIGIVFVLMHTLSLYYFFNSKHKIEKLLYWSPFKIGVNKYQVGFMFTLFLQLIFWQFTQFVLIVEIIAILIIYLFNHISQEKLKEFFLLIISTWVITLLYLMGSIFIATSLFFFISFSYLLILKIIALKNIKQIRFSQRLLSLSLGLLSGVTLHSLINKIFSQQNDSHVFKFISAQFKPSSDFHAKLYLCDEAFNTMSSTQISGLFSTGYLYLLIISLLGTSIYLFKNFFLKKNLRSNKNESYIYYLVLIIIGFSIIAFSSRRFSVIAFPLSILIIPYFLSLISNSINDKFKFKNTFSFIVIIISLIIFIYNKNTLFAKYDRQRPVAGPTMTQLSNAIKNNTKPTDTFAASMPLSSNIRLLTGRKIFIHPQYENEKLRQRVKNVYKIYGNFNDKKLHHYFKSNKIDYLVTEGSYCYYKSSTGCVMQKLINEGKKENPSQFCDKNFSGSQYFEQVFDNKRFKILKVK